MTALSGRAAQAARDDLAQPCPVDPAHRIRPVGIHLYVSSADTPVASLLGVCAVCWPAEVTILEKTVPITREQIRSWRMS